jgi:hypothetical protein
MTIERSREDLEMEIVELRDRVELLEDQVRRMLESAIYVEWRRARPGVAEAPTGGG